MKFTVKQIAEILGARIEGNPALEIHSLSKIEEGKAGTLSFLANPKYNEYIYTTGASAVIVSNEFEAKEALKTTLLRVPDPYLSFTFLLEKAQQINGMAKVGIEQPSFISPSAKIGKNVYIAAFVSIGNFAIIGDGVKIYPNSTIGDRVEIGEESLIYAGVSIYHGCKIGNRCIVHSNSVIGSDGFGFAPQSNGALKKIPQTGIVEIEDDVEIGAGCTIDRATLGSTIIRKGVKLDNQVQIAHNVEIGECTVIAAQSGVSGSTKIGKYCMVGGQVGIVGHISLADFTKIGAQSGLSKSVEKTNTSLRGSPAQDYRKQLRSEVLFQQLETLAKKLHALEKKFLNKD